MTVGHTGFRKHLGSQDSRKQRAAGKARLLPWQVAALDVNSKCRFIANHSTPPEICSHLLPLHPCAECACGHV